MLIYIIFFVLLALMAVEYEFSRFKRWPVLVITIFILALLAGLRGPQVAKDYSSYQYVFDAIYTYFTEIKNGSLFNFVEPGFVLVVVAIRGLWELNYAVYVMLFFAFASLSVKLYAMDRLALNPFLAILLYFTHYFALLEMTQIRIGFASALFFVAILQYLKGQRITFILLVMLAIAFHYSAIAYLLVLLINYKNLNRWFYSAVMILAVALGLLKIPLFDIISQLNPDLIAGKLKGYEYISKSMQDAQINTFNVVYIVNVLCILFILFCIPQKQVSENRSLVLFTKCNILSVFLLSFLSGTPLIAFRVSELFGITSIFMFAAITRYLPFRRLNIVVPVVLAGLFFYINYFHNQLLSAYELAHFR